MEHLRAAARTIGVDRATAEVVHGFGEAGIPCLLLKGPVLARALYGDEARSYMDADLLVPPDRVEDAERALAALGFEGPPREAFRGRWTPSGIEHRRGDGGRIDLHATVHGATADARDVWPALAAESETMTLSGTEVRVPRSGAVAYLVATHAAHHGVDVVKPLRDLERAVERLPVEAWREAVVLADRLGGRAAFAEGIRLVPAGAALAERLGVPAPTSLQTALQAMSPPVSALGWERVLAAHGWPSKVRTFARELIPPRAYMRTWAAEPGLTGAALGRAYARRLTGLVREAPSALAALRRARREARRRSSRAA